MTFFILKYRGAMIPAFLKKLIFLLLLLYSINGFTQTIDGQDKVVLKQYSDTIKRAEVISGNVAVLAKVSAGKTALFKKEFKEDILRQLNEKWFIVKYKDSLQKGTAFTEAVYPANNNWKLSPALLFLKDSVPLSQQFLFLIGTDDCAALLQTLPASSGRFFILNVYQQKVLVVKSSLSFIRSYFFNNPHVSFIDIKQTKPREEMVINDYDNSVNAINLFFTKYPLVNGSGLTASIKENLFDTSDIDFKNRYLQTSVAGTVITTHATTMATLIGGGGNSFFTGKGIEWGCRLTSSDFANLLPDDYSSYQQNHISVQNHSYGTSIENFYGSDAAAYDQTLIDNPNLVFVFSAGNSGTLKSTTGQYAGTPYFANLTGSFKQSKNTISVGSADSFYHIPVASSKGPAYDGRIKPELVAYGNDGSSGAAAITSGTALAIQSAYALLHHDSLPANNLVKAILINSADDVFTTGPDFYSGYGNVNTYAAVKSASSGNYFKGAVAENKTDSFLIQIPEGLKSVKVTLAWNDVPAQPNAFTALVNDLDLEVQHADNGKVWLPWVLNSENDSAALLAPAQRKRDSLNVAEQVTIDNPPAGNYTIRIKGHAVEAGFLQSFAIVYNRDTADTFQFISPAAGDHFGAGSKCTFRWKQSYTKASGRLEYSLNKGSTWQLINSKVPLDSNYYSWTGPDTFAVALARMIVDNASYVSDTFSLSKQLYPQVVYSCGDSVLVTWNKFPGVQQYKILQLGQQYLENYAQTADTNYVIKNSLSPYIAVVPLVSASQPGIGSYTFNYNTQGAGCYVNNFLADLTNDNKAKLDLLLGTTAGIKSIQLQQLINNYWQTIVVLQPVAAHLSYLYDSLHSGNNFFRALITLSNGTSIISDTAAILYFKNRSFLVFPNPLPQGGQLHISSAIPDTYMLVIYDALGRKIVEQEINNATNTISTQALAKGVYFLILYSNGKQVLKSSQLIQ